jgi:hypothetical protein
MKARLCENSTAGIITRPHNKPQINADKRRFVPAYLVYMSSFTANISGIMTGLQKIYTYFSHGLTRICGYVSAFICGFVSHSYYGYLRTSL